MKWSIMIAERMDLNDF